MKTKKETPYLYQQYHIKPFYQASSGSASGTLFKIYNSVVEGLNSDNKLPEYIIVLLDRDIILDLDYFVPGTLFILHQEIKWLSKQLDRVLTARWECLKQLSPGAVDTETKIIWINMLQRPFIKHPPFPTYNLVVKLRSKFNKILEQEARKSKYSYILDVKNVPRNSGNFDTMGNLTFAGKTEFWKEVNYFRQTEFLD